MDCTALRAILNYTYVPNPYRKSLPGYAITISVKEPRPLLK